MSYDPGDETRKYICEDCYRESHHRKKTLVKAYKHCILRESITPSSSRKICHCDTVPHFDANGRSLALFPVSKKDNHFGASSAGGLQCGLLKLGELVAEAKYVGMQTMITRRVKLSEEKRQHEARVKEQRAKEQKMAAKAASRPGPGWKIVTEASFTDPSQRSSATGSTAVAEEKEADDDIPFFIRRYTEQYPFGNVHMALRIGPLIIENGVAK